MSTELPQVLAATSLSCRRGDRLLFRGLNLTPESGHVAWVRGHNGRGRTSLLRMLAGLALPAEGQITWGGVCLRRAGSAYLRNLTCVAHVNAIKEDLSALESLGFLARLHGQQAGRPTLETALRRLGLHSRRDAPVRTLSQGQRRRVALARLAVEPVKPLCILDEPFDALDAEGLATMGSLIEAQAQRGGGVVLTSHQAPPLTHVEPISVQLEGFKPP